MLELTKQKLKPTYDDAGLYLKVLELLSDDEVVAAMIVLLDEDAIRSWRDDAKRIGLIKLFNIMEATGVLFKNKLMHEDLMFASMPVSHLWDKAKPIVEQIRRRTGIFTLYASFEEMAESARRWMEDEGR
jgi:hypothetical protein